jgi:septum formation protein
VDGTILNKPVDEADAVRMLRMLSSRVHQVITGVCLVQPMRGVPMSTSSHSVHRSAPDVPYRKLSEARQEFFIGSETTSVTMSEMSEQEIHEYVATGEPMDKAGAYAIQGRASRWIPRIEGDYSNVVGLPVALVYRMLTGN